MLEWHRKDRGQKPQYNEIIIDAYKFNWNLPRSIEAFFWLEGSACGAQCIDTARHAHSLFTKKFGHAADAVPLLVLDLENAEQPFIDAPPR